MKVKKNNKALNWMRLVSVLCCIVVFCTTYALILPAVTLSKDTYCGKEAHTHDAECYREHDKSKPLCGLEEGESSEGHVHDASCYQTQEVGKTLICGLEEDGEHVHSDDCYETQVETVLVCGKEEGSGATEGHVHNDDCYISETPICGKEEHEHSHECYSNKEDVEDPKDWEEAYKDINKEEDAKTRILTVAKNEVGYKENEANFTVDENDAEHYYTRYGHLYEDMYGDWNNYFTGYVLKYANVKMNFDKDISKWQNKTIDDQIKDEEKAEEGNVVFFRDDEGELRSGIVTKIDSLTKEIRVIEGDVDGQVKEERIKKDKVIAYLSDEVTIEDEDTPLAGDGVEKEEDNTESSNPLSSSKSVIITGYENIVKPGETVTLLANITGFGEKPNITYQWKVNTSENCSEDAWQEIEGATDSQYTFEVTEDNIKYFWKVSVYEEEKNIGSISPEAQGLIQNPLLISLLRLNSTKDAKEIDSDPVALSDGDIIIKFDKNGGSGTMEDKKAYQYDSIELPICDYTKKDSTFVGWSTNQYFNNAQQGNPPGQTVKDGIYQPGEEYLLSTSATQITFYAIWGKNSSNTQGAHFYIRLDGSTPDEPGATYQESAYTLGIKKINALKHYGYVVNRTDGINPELIVNGPTNEQIVNVMNGTGHSSGKRLPNGIVSVKYNSETNSIIGTTSNNEEKEFYVKWYVSKATKQDPNGTYFYDGDSNSWKQVGKDISYSTWHVDGVLLEKGKLNVEYNKNAPEATVKDMPQNFQIDEGKNFNIGLSGNRTDWGYSEPKRSGYRFLGWSKDRNNYDVNNLLQNEEIVKATQDEVNIGKDTIRYYAIWARGDHTLEITKVDDSNPENPIEGIEFTMTRYTINGNEYIPIDSSKQTHITNKNGFVLFDNIYTDIIYKIEETDTNGYQRIEPFYFSIINENGVVKSVSWKDSDGSNISDRPSCITNYVLNISSDGVNAELKVKIQNKIQRNLLEIVKTNTGGTTTLSGAKFVLSSENAIGGYEEKEITSNENGILLNENLSFGTYELKEIQAPNGYNLLNDVIKFEVDSNGVQIINNADSKLASIEQSENTWILKVFNTAGESLPNTGGAGTKLFTFSGAAVIAASGLMYGYKKKKDKRNGKGGLRK